MKSASFLKGLSVTEESANSPWHIICLYQLRPRKRYSA